ncbi:hypothetical protein [Ferruginibacter sp. SUN106]|uniref:hypothetical protein n=1 Tax=Ferruginibacter sp. SUN106 TaxID=2978348 RepID=UPI003D362599
MQQFKKLVSAVIQRPLMLLLIALVFMASCTEEKGEGVFVPVPKDTSALAKIDHFISRQQIKDYQAAFAMDRDSLQKCRPGFSIPFSEAFNKKALIEILQIPDCVGIKVLYGLKKDGDSSSMRLMLVGVDSKGNNLYLHEDGKSHKVTDDAGTKKDTAAPAARAAKSDSRMPGDSTGGVEQGQCDPPCTSY